MAAVLLLGGYAYLHDKGPSTAHGGPAGDSPAPAVTAPATGGGGGSASANAGAPAGSGAFVFATGTTAEPRIYAFIDSARTRLDMTMYELSDATAVADLIARKKAGVDVRVVLDQKEKPTNQAAFDELGSAGVGVVWSSPTFSYTHQKTITVDDRESLILTGNLTSRYYALTRDFGDLDSDPEDVRAIVAVFDADYAHSPVSPADADDLLWSPTSARSRVLGVIAGAHRSLDVEGEELDDSAVVDALAARAKAGVAVRVVVESPSQYASAISEISAAGGKVVGYSSTTGLYIHAKTVIADAGLSDQAVEMGSMNYTSVSLGRNRELGVILHDGAGVGLFEKQFAADFAGGTPQG